MDETENRCSGATMVEYMLVAVLLAIGLIWFRLAFLYSVQNDYDKKKNTLNYVNHNLVLP